MALSKHDEQIIQLFESGAVRSRIAAVQHIKPTLNRKDASEYARELWKRAEVLDRRAAEAEAGQQDAQAVISAQRFRWRAISEGIDAMLIEAGVCEAALQPDRNNELFDAVTVLKPAQGIPAQAMPFIQRVALVTVCRADGEHEQRRAIIPVQYGEKERLRASELLAKSYGSIIERQELSGVGGKPIETVSITADMNPCEASRIYHEIVKNAAQ
ncbi:hypothetical protein VCSRO104_3614 [Vibrio cholerae]|uniref:hypothetical protein n=1 Tax=Vibrio cholerae TaxID=666 RepID=UPI0011DB7FAC|nr:hypothetical protein [Vibrio cholerae]TXY35556.1 hypothetical protein FXE83_05910 [Vibrio cholerae]GHW87325.1 hypothetical protein VCSRO104_3614 [Vibrio cholerae]